MSGCPISMVKTGDHCWAGINWGKREMKNDNMSKQKRGLYTLAMVNVGTRPGASQKEPKSGEQNLHKQKL